MIEKCNSTYDKITFRIKVCRNESLVMNELKVGSFNKEDYEKVLQNNHVNSPLLAKILASRGIIEDHQIDAFLHPSLNRD